MAVGFLFRAGGHPEQGVIRFFGAYRVNAYTQAVAECIGVQELLSAQVAPRGTPYLDPPYDRTNSRNRHFGADVLFASPSVDALF